MSSVVITELVDCHRQIGRKGEEHIAKAVIPSSFRGQELNTSQRIYGDGIFIVTPQRVSALMCCMNSFVQFRSCVSNLL